MNQLNPNNPNQNNSPNYGYIFGGAAAALGGLYFLYKGFGSSENEEDESVDCNSRSATTLDEDAPVVQRSGHAQSVINRTNQCNPNHKPTGPGHSRGYHGFGDKEDLDNHSNQKNPNNWRYQPPRS